MSKYKTTLNICSDTSHNDALEIVNKMRKRAKEIRDETGVEIPTKDLIIQNTSEFLLIKGIRDKVLEKNKKQASTIFRNLLRK